MTPLILSTPLMIIVVPDVFICDGIYCRFAFSARGQFLCHICRISFKSRNGLLGHEVLQHGGKPRYSCTVCNKGFMSKANLVPHELSHAKVGLLIRPLQYLLTAYRNLLIFHRNLFIGKLVWRSGRA